MNNVSRLYRDPENASDISEGNTSAANQSSISGSSHYSEMGSLSGKSTLEEIRHLLLGDQPSKQSADVERLNSRMDSLEKHLITRLDEQNNEITQLRALLFQAQQDRNAIAADQKLLKANSETALSDIQTLYARQNEELHDKLEKKLANQSDMFAQSLKQVAELISQNTAK